MKADPGIGVQEYKFSFLEVIAMKTESPLQILDDNELGHVTGGMFRAARWATKGKRMGDGSVEGQQGYKDRQAAEAKARTAEALSALKASNPGGYNRLMHPSPFPQAPPESAFIFKPNPHPGHPEFKPGN